MEEDSMLIDPEILQKELVISLPILTESDIEAILNGEETSSSLSTSSDDDDKEKPCLKRDQRRLNLLKNPNYGIILCFMQKFRSYIHLKNYPLRIFEDNLISERGQISRRFMDFHLTLLKKISCGKTFEQNEFVSSMTKFAYRFNRNDGVQLDEHGYAKARIDTKLRILKNLLEQQFDRNSTLKTAVADKPSFDIHSKPFGRDRFGASYWLFTDTDCFIRLFREDTDENLTWKNLAKNPQELENVIKLLSSDQAVRKKFPDWKFSKESFDDLPASNQFEEEFARDIVKNKEKSEESDDQSLTSVIFGSTTIKTDQINLHPIVNLNRDLPASPSESLSSKDNPKSRNSTGSTSDQDSIGSEIIGGNRARIPSSSTPSPSSSSNDTKEEIYSNGLSEESNEKLKTNKENHVEVIVLKPSLEQGVKRKLVDYDDTGSEIGSTKSEEASQNVQATPVVQVPKNNADLPIALRRTRRGRQSFMGDLSADSSSTSQSFSQSSRKRRNVNGRWKNFNQSSRTRSRRRRGGRKGNHEFSSTTSSDRQPSEDDFSDEYIRTNSEFDKLLVGEFLEEEDDDDEDDDDYIPHRRAKTVALCHELFQIQSKPCSHCSQTDRPELLLLCEDCNDAYHLECIKPELLSIPNDDWYCPLCEHKRLCDGLMEKLVVLIKEEANLEMKRRLNVSKRRKRLTNVTVSLDRCVAEPAPKKRKVAMRILSSGDDDDKESEKKVNTNNNGEKESEKKLSSTDDDSVYGCKNDENRKPSDQEETEQTGKRRVRACRKKAQNYSLDDYDKKIKEAMIDAGVNKELIDNDSDDSDDIMIKRKASKKRTRYELDEDFDASDGKRADADFVPSRRRTIHSDSRTVDEDSRTMNDNSRITNDDSRSDGRDDDYGMSDDDIAWRNRRHSSVSSIVKKKSTTKSSGNYQPKSFMISDEDTISYDPNDESNLTTPTINVKTEPTNTFAENEFPINAFGKTEIVKNVYDKNRIVENVVYTNEAANINKPRRPRRPAAKKKKTPAIQEENVSDEDEPSRPPPAKRLPNKKRRGSNDSSLDDDDDYEKLVHKRRLFRHGKAITRKSITGHIKQLLGQEEDDEEEEEEEENGEGATKEKSSDETKKDGNNNSKQANPNSQYEELRLSDDDDFPDDQEILKTTGLLSLKKPANGPKPAPLRAPFMPSMQSYQFVMVDPTAQFEFTCPPEEPITEPSDSNQANGDNTQSTTT